MNQPESDPDPDRRPWMLLDEIPVWIVVVMSALFILIVTMLYDPYV